MVVGGFGLRIFVHVVSDRVLGSGYKRGRGSKLAVLLGGWFERNWFQVRRWSLLKSSPKTTWVPEVGSTLVRFGSLAEVMGWGADGSSLG